MEDNICEEITIKIKLFDIYKDNKIWKFKDTNLPLEGKYEDENGTIRYFKNGKYHNENGPAYIRKNGNKEYYINGKDHRIDGPSIIYSNGVHYWYINDHRVSNEAINNWLEENNIPLDWNIWTDSDKMMFALYWSDYNG